MNTQKYNGWTNYATWRVYQEIFDGVEYDELMGPNTLEDIAMEVVSQGATMGSLADSYALAFIADVNWFEISQHVNVRYMETLADSYAISTSSKS